jgi:glycosyltransferase involved in cell wall biosynthesis
MSSASVSVCIPTRNRAALLTTAIESVLAQSFQDFELVVMDNASEDDTEAVVRAFGDPRLRYIRHPENIGAGANFNAGLRAAESEFVILLCDDDTLDPEFLATAVPALRSDGRVGLVYSTWRRRDPDGTVEDRVINLTGRTERSTIPGPELSELIIRQSMVAHMSGVLMRRAAIPSNGFDLRDSFAMDFGLLLRIAARWDAVFLPEPLLSIGQERDSLTARIVGLGPSGRPRWDVGDDVKRREVKLRFLEGPGKSLPNAAALRRAVRRYFRCRVMWHSGVALRSGGQLGAARRALAQGIAVDTGVIWDPYAWRSGLAALAGPALANRLRRPRM